MLQLSLTFVALFAWQAIASPLVKDNLPKSIDWRKQGIVGPVSLGGYPWAFAVTGAVEAVQAKKASKFVRLSAQNLIDCVPGGSGAVNITDAFEYVRKNGIDTDESYPFTGVHGPKCLYDPKNVGAAITDFAVIQPDNEEELKRAVAKNGPVAVFVRASLSGLSTYVKGIFEESACSNAIDFPVLIVGYGTENGQDFWIAKNNWGTKWGEAGYIRLARNSNSACRMIGLAAYPSIYC